jgi:hypothetical protein
MFLLSRWTGNLVKRVGARLPLVLGPSITAIGFILFAIPNIGGSYWTTFFPAVLVMSIGMSITVAPLTTTVMNAVSQHYTGTASGINNALARTAGLIAIASLGIVIALAFHSNLDQHLTLLHLPTALQQMVEAQSSKLAGISIPQGSHAHAQLKQAIDQSFVASFRLIVLICAGLALASALAAGIMIGRKNRQNTNYRL